MQRGAAVVSDSATIKRRRYHRGELVYVGGCDHPHRVTGSKENAHGFLYRTTCTGDASYRCPWQTWTNGVFLAPCGEQDDTPTIYGWSV